MSDALQQELRAKFREVSSERLARMRALLERLDEPESLQLLGRDFHAMAGLGATYGYPAISELGDEGEAAIVPMVRAGALPDPAAIERWRELTAAIARELECGSR